MDEPLITLETDLNKLPRLERGVHPGRHRVYFQDAESGVELTDHPLFASGWFASHGMATDAAGAFIRGTLTGVSLIVWTDSGPRLGHITADSFPGQRVSVHVWHGPDHDLNETRILQNNSQGNENDCQS